MNVRPSKTTNLGARTIGGDPLATCTLPVGVVYLLTYLPSVLTRDMIYEIQDDDTHDT